MLQGKIIDKFGTEFWYKDGDLHREDGPAVITEDGEEYWFRNNLLHREDGPALIPKEGSKAYYLNDKEIDKEEYLNVLTCPNDDLPLYINTELAPVVRRRLQNATG